MGDDNNSNEAAALRLSSDFKLKECPAFIGSTGREGKGPKVWAFNDADIPLSISGFNDKKQVSVGLVVVDCSMSGYTRVPYECTSGDRYKVGKNALPLSEKSVWPGDPEGQLHMLTCWPYGIVEGCPKDKDDRNEEYKWEIHPGMVIRASFWSDAARGGDPKKFRESLCPAGLDVIPAFTLMEVELVCKGWSKWEPGDKRDDGKRDRDICPVKKGYGIGINAMSVLQGVSLYSVLDKLGKVLPPTLDASKAKQQAWQSKFHSIKDLIQTDKVPFLVKKVSPKTNVDLDERPEVSSDAKQLRLSQWSPNHSCGEAGQFIDILYEHAQAATNCPDIRSACALLELAANAGALSVVVCFNQYRPGQKQTKSTLYGYPMIDTKTLLSCIQVPVDPHSLETDQSGRFFAFETYFQVLFPPIPKGVGVPTLKHGESQAAEDSDGDGAEDNDENHDEPEEGEGEMHTPLLLISKEPLTNIKGSHSQVLSPDFMLVGNNVQLARGYYAKFVHPDRQQECVLWGGYVSMVKPQVQMAGAALAAGGTSGSSSSASAAAQRNKRARWMAEEASKFDPFAGQESEASKKKPAPTSPPLVEGRLVASSEEPPATAAAPSGSKKDKKSKSK